MLDNITRVKNRITEIKRRFAPEAAYEEDFSLYLAKAQREREDVSPTIRRRSSSSANASYDKNSIKDMLIETAQKYGVDSKLVLAVASAESGYRADAVSSAGAVGVMQLMPGTARSLGVTDRFDARQNIDGGVRYLRQMLSLFGGDTAKALAAYNAGPGAVERHGGIPPYGETQAYVKNILGDLTE
jgi:soluble lytic murein transglycosylase-like protein